MFTLYKVGRKVAGKTDTIKTSGHHICIIYILYTLYDRYVMRRGLMKYDDDDDDQMERR